MSSGSSFDFPGKQQRLNELREAASAPDLWSDQERAQSVTRELSRLEGSVRRFEELSALVDDLQAANELAAEDASFASEIADGIAKLEAALETLEQETLFAGDLDDHDALVTIHAGEGGTDAMDWSEMLLRMYLRWADAHGYTAEVREALAGEEAGVKSATVEIHGPNAYGLLQSEHGVHRLVRLSPFDSAHRRHTAFASVDVIPDFGEDEVEVEINPDDLRIETFRAGGPGGQYVNTTDSAVRLTHIPTGIQSSCQSERSQLQNKAVAMKMLTVRLTALKLRERQAELAKLRGEQLGIGFGSQIRSYVLNPYQMVKDRRSDIETSNVQAVLDGDLDAFMTGYLRWRRSTSEHP